MGHTPTCGSERMCASPASAVTIVHGCPAPLARVVTRCGLHPGWRGNIEGGRGSHCSIKRLRRRWPGAQDGAHDRNTASGWCPTKGRWLMAVESSGKSQGNPRIYELIEGAPKTGRSPTVWAWPQLVEYLKVAAQPVQGPWPPHQQPRPDPTEDSMPVAVPDPASVAPAAPRPTPAEASTQDEAPIETI